MICIVIKLWYFICKAGRAHFNFSQAGGDTRL